MTKSKKILYGFTLGILVFLVACTFVSAQIFEINMPVVEVMKPVEMELEINDTESKMYDTVVRVSAIITGSENRKYVYIARERKGLFGQEHYAVLLEVRVIAENDIYAALGGWNVTVFDDVVVSSSKDLTSGDVVRVIDD
jgi:hypothetical protein